MKVSQAADTPTQASDAYDSIWRGFRWAVPQRLNIAQECCHRWAQQPGMAQRTAIRVHRPGEAPRLYSYAELARESNRLAEVLLSLGVERGDRVGIVMPQRFETAVAYMAVLQVGAVAMPLSMLFGPEALEYRLHDSEAAVLICDEAALPTVRAVRGNCPLLQTVLATGGVTAASHDEGELDLAASMARAAVLDDHPPAVAHTEADDPAVLIYTSGTTGNPKGALIPQRALFGNLTGFICSQNWFGFDPYPQPVQSPSPARGRAGEGAVHSPGQSPAAGDQNTPVFASPSPARGRAGEGAVHSPGQSPAAGDQNTPVFWSPADWAWTGGLMDALLPTLYFGREIVAYAGRFSAETAFDILQSHRVTHTFLFPTALKAMMKACPQPRGRYRLELQAIMSAGEAVGDAVFNWCRDELGVLVNEMFGQTEINYIVGNCTRLWPARPGSMGKGYPGHWVQVIDEEGNECPVGVPGDVAVNRLDIHGHPDPVFFLGYWKNEGATRAKYTRHPVTGDWCRTGDLAVRDADGYLWYQGRADDVFKAAGYRIGPSEIENCLVKHPAVANAAVVPKPDPDRGAVVKAYVVLAPGHAGDEALVAQLQRHVRGQLAPYEYPKEIEFIDTLPMTTTGKVQRRVLRLQEEQRARDAAAKARR